jgi:hypothetical protein
VLKILDISHLTGRRIHALSGGEAKRVHVGIELLSSPTILFLDEPLAGLDPGLVHKFMQLFRSLCDRGHTLLLTTHTLEQIELCGKILFVSRGRIVFDGTPDEARAALGVKSLAGMYDAARAESWKASAAGEKQDGKPAYHPQAVGMLSEHAPAYHPRTAGAVRQFFVLARRYAKIFVRDRRNLWLVLLQAPFIALLLSMVFSTSADFLPVSFYFCVTISAIWIGGVNSIREIAREWRLFDREYRVGLRAGPYCCAKTAVFMALGFLQAALFCVALHVLFSAFTFTAALYSLTAAGCLCGSILGLCISAFSGTVTRAISWLPIVFIPQIFLSGILIPFDQMPLAGRLLSHLTFSRPVFAMLKKVCILEENVWALTEWRALALLAIVLIILMLARVRWHYMFLRAARQ